LTVFHKESYHFYIKEIYLYMQYISRKNGYFIPNDRNQYIVGGNGCMNLDDRVGSATHCGGETGWSSQREVVVNQS